MSNFGVISIIVYFLSQFLTDCHMKRTNLKLKTCSLTCTHNYYVEIPNRGQTLWKTLKMLLALAFLAPLWPFFTLYAYIYNINFEEVLSFNLVGHNLNHDEGLM